MTPSRLAALAAILVLGLGCHQERRPDPRIDELAGRMLRLEARHAEIEALVAKLQSMAGVPQRLRELEDRLGTSSIDALAAQLEQLGIDLAQLKEQVSRVAAAPATQPTRPRGPDPNAVYSVPIAGDPFTGPAHAKVTLIQGFEFA